MTFGKLKRSCSWQFFWGQCQGLIGNGFKNLAEKVNIFIRYLSHVPVLGKNAIIEKEFVGFYGRLRLTGLETAGNPYTKVG